MSETAEEDKTEHDVMISYSHADSKQVAKELYEVAFRTTGTTTNQGLLGSRGMGVSGYPLLE